MGSMQQVIITCDARPASSLDWKHLRKSTLMAVAQGKKILWFLDFGLFADLKWGLDHPGQFSSFNLAIDHFKKEVWSEFHKFSSGIALYKGNPNFLPQFPWDEKQKANLSDWLKDRFPTIELLKSESKGSFIDYALPENVLTFEGNLILQLFARDVCAEYLVQLSRRAIGEIQAYVLFDPMPEDPLLSALFTDPDRYEGIEIEPNIWKTDEERESGIYMPGCTMAKPSCLIPYRDILYKQRDCKLIPEDQLVSSWHGLNELFVYPNAISKEGHRKMQGFLAAGGVILNC